MGKPTQRGTITQALWGAATLMAGTGVLFAAQDLNRHCQEREAKTMAEEQASDQTMSERTEEPRPVLPDAVEPNDVPADTIPEGEPPPATVKGWTGRLADPEERARRVEELQRQSNAALERARKWAERTGAPMRIETNGVVMVLVDYTEESGPLYKSTLSGAATSADE